MDCGCRTCKRRNCRWRNWLAEDKDGLAVGGRRRLGLEHQDRLLLHEASTGRLGGNRSLEVPLALEQHPARQGSQGGQGW